MARNGFFMQTQFIRCYVSGIDCHPHRDVRVAIFFVGIEFPGDTKLSVRREKGEIGENGKADLSGSFFPGFPLSALRFR